MLVIPNRHARDLFHVHVFPRRPRDHLYERRHETRWTSPEEGASYVERLRRALDDRAS